MNVQVCLAPDEGYAVSDRKLLAAASDVPEYHGDCGADKLPLVSVAALHEAHIFIFCIALSHILVSVRAPTVPMF